VYESAVREGLERVDLGVRGERPWDLHVHDPRVYQRIAREGALGLGESYQDGWWDCEQLDGLFERLARMPKQRTRSVAARAHRLAVQALNRQSRRRAREVVDAHYDLPARLFEVMLDPAMQYSCGWWEGAADLEQAQRDKMDRIAAKLELEDGMHVLEIGGGWGGLAHHLAGERGARVTSLNISEGQMAVARQRCAGMPVSVERCDYRDVQGTYERIVSVEMLEAVGNRNLRTYFEAAHRVLAPGGLFVLQTIAENRPRPHPDRWITKHIFPNGELPSPSRLGAAVEGLFVIEDWQAKGLHYDPTLLAWHRRFEAAWPEIEALGFDDRFRRTWRYYLLCCAGSFRARTLQVWQLILSRGDRPWAPPPVGAA
jgi:cyclopropane-fatty-acyl-phospholipid synthase